MDFRKLDFLLSDDTDDLKKIMDNFMHFPCDQFVNERKEDEKILIGCMKYALTSNGGTVLLEESDSNYSENTRKRKRTTDEASPLVKKYLPGFKTNFKTMSSVAIETKEVLYKDKSDLEFFAEFKVTKKTFLKILNEITSSKHFNRTASAGASATRPEVSLEIFLTYLCKKSTFKTLSSKFHMSESAIMSNFTRCVVAINSLASKYVEWCDDNQAPRVVAQFEGMSGLPGIIGSLGACCIEMRTIKEPPAGYKIGRQKSIMYLLGVADEYAKFTYLQAGYPATFSPQEAFESSSLGTMMNDPESTVFPSDQHHLIAASHSFILHENLLTRYEFPDNTAQEEYNQRLIKCDTIEKAFIHLKSRFGLLRQQIYSSLEKIPSIIKSCCIIHNICFEDPDDYDFLRPFIVSDSTDYSPFVDDSDFDPLVPTTKAMVKRDNIVASLKS